MAIKRGDRKTCPNENCPNENREFWTIYKRKKYCSTSCRLEWNAIVAKRAKEGKEPPVPLKYLKGERRENIVIPTRCRVKPSLNIEMFLYYEQLEFLKTVDRNSDKTDTANEFMVQVLQKLKKEHGVNVVCCNILSGELNRDISLFDTLEYVSEIIMEKYKE